MGGTGLGGVLIGVGIGCGGGHGVGCSPLSIKYMCMCVVVVVPTTEAACVVSKPWLSQQVTFMRVYVWGVYLRLKLCSSCS